MESRENTSVVRADGNHICQTRLRRDSACHEVNVTPGDALSLSDQDLGPFHDYYSLRGAFFGQMPPKMPYAAAHVNHNGGSSLLAHLLDQFPQLADLHAFFWAHELSWFLAVRLVANLLGSELRPQRKQLPQFGKAALKALFVGAQR